MDNLINQLKNSNISKDDMEFDFVKQLIFYKNRIFQYNLTRNNMMACLEGHTEYLYVQCKGTCDNSHYGDPYFYDSVDELLDDILKNNIACYDCEEDEEKINTTDFEKQR